MDGSQLAAANAHVEGQRVALAGNDLGEVVQVVLDFQRAFGGQQHGAPQLDAVGDRPHNQQRVTSKLGGGVGKREFESVKLGESWRSKP